jgi:hypothetical protein
VTFLRTHPILGAQLPLGRDSAGGGRLLVVDCSTKASNRHGVVQLFHAAGARAPRAVDIDLALLDDTRERVNITLPRRVLARIDAKAAGLGETRSG